MVHFLRFRALVAVALAHCALMVGIVHAAAPPAAKCAGAKQKAAGAKVAATLKCNATALLALTAQQKCLDKANLKFTTAFMKAESAGGCAITGDAATVDRMVDAAVAAVMAIEPATQCTSVDQPCSISAPGTGFCEVLQDTGNAALLGCVSLNNVPHPPCAADYDCQIALPPGAVCVGGFCRYAVD